MERSKLIKDFENYLISPDGRVFSLKRQIYLKPRMVRGGYYLVCLCKNGREYQKYIARLVAQAFIPNTENKPEVNHIDGIKENNDVSNLEWVTHKENIQHAMLMGLHSSNKKQIPINVYDYATGEFKSFHPSICEAVRIYDLNKRNTFNVLAGKQNHTGGLTFTKA